MTEKQIIEELEAEQSMFVQTAPVSGETSGSLRAWCHDAPPAAHLHQANRRDLQAELLVLLLLVQPRPVEWRTVAAPLNRQALGGDGAGRDVLLTIPPPRRDVPIDRQRFEQLTGQWERSPVRRR